MDGTSEGQPVDATRDASPLGSTPPAATTDAVSTALHRLDEIAGLPLERRPDAFHEIHEHLRSALAAIDDA